MNFLIITNKRLSGFLYEISGVLKKSLYNVLGPYNKVLGPYNKVAKYGNRKSTVPYLQKNWDKS